MSDSEFPRSMLVIPTFNEELRLGDGSYFNELAKRALFGMCFVDDGSTDGTASVLEDLESSTSGSLLRLPRNRGKAEAVRQGMIYVCRELNPTYIGFIDSDGAFPVESVSTFMNSAHTILETNPSVEVVISSRVKLAGRKIERSSNRHYISRILITFIGFFIRELPYDSQSGLKLFRNNELLRKALDQPFATKWFFDIELLSRMRCLERNTVWEEPVNGWHDISGSHLNWKKSPSLLREILTIIKLGRPATRNQM